MDTSPHHVPWGTGCGKAQFSLCEISAYAPLRHRKSSFLRGVVRVSCCKSESCSASLRSKTAVETKRAALMQQVLEMQVSVETRPEHWVRRAAIEANNEWHWDGDGAAEDAPAEFLERITVNFIRHNLTAYDRALEEVAGRVGIASAVRSKDLLSHRRAIGESYPALADECSRQLMRRGL